MLTLTFWLAAANLAQLLLGLGRSVLLARWLGPAQSGLLGHTLALVTLADAVGQWGVSTIVTREAAAKPRQDGMIVGTAIGLRVGQSLVVGLVLWTLSGPWAVLLLLGTVGQVGIGFLRARLLRTPQILAGLTPGVLSCAAVVACWRFGRPSASLALATLAITGAVAAAIQLALAASRLHRRLAWSTRTAKQLLTSSWPLWVSGLAVAFLYRQDVLMLKWLLAPRAAEHAMGYYQVAYTLTESGSFLLGALVTAAFPLFASLHRVSEPRLRDTYLRALGYALALGAVAWGATLLIGGPLIHRVYGPAFGRSAAALRMLAPALLFVLVNSLTASLLVARHRQMALLWIVAATVAFNFLVNCWAIPVFGFVGAAATTTAAEAFETLLLFWSVRRWLGGR